MKKLLLPALLTSTACATEEAGEFDAILALSGDVANGELVYTSNCSGCHAADGTGGAGPDLTASAPAHSDAQILEVVVYGAGTMPPYGEALSDQDLADLVVWLRDAFGEYDGHGDHDHAH